MSISSARAEPGNLARMRLVLSTGHARRGWIAWCALVVAALLAGAGASHYFGHFYGNYYGNDYGHTWRAQPGALQQPAGASQDVQPLQHAQYRRGRAY